MTNAAKRPVVYRDFYTAVVSSAISPYRLQGKKEVGMLFFNVIARLRICFAQLPFKHPVTSCRTVAHQSRVNYLTELGTSHARK